LSVAALPYDDATKPEDFSSHGFAANYFGPVVSDHPAAALPMPQVLQKPDIAATDGGQNTFFGDSDGNLYRFYGTSAAAPHAASVAALMEQRARQRRVSLDQTRTASILAATAAAVQKGTRNSVGAGRVDAFAALKALDALPSITYLPIFAKSPAP
jgi:hypothetical protein